MRRALIALRNVVGFLLILGFCYSVVTALIALVYFFLTGRL